MILIISQEQDYSTSEVIQWLKYYKNSYFRINAEDVIKLKTITISNSNFNNAKIIKNNNFVLDLDKISAFWYRRGRINFSSPSLPNVIDSDLERIFLNHLKDENNILEAYIYFLLNRKPHIGSFETRGLNKLIVLNEAQNAGILIPDTWILTKKKDFPRIKKVATKCISESLTARIKQGAFTIYTEKISQNQIPSNYFPTLFQVLLEKEADIRTFYLNGKFFSMAIRSQSHKQTSIDFRKYLSQNPSRHFPFKLPNSLEHKISALMKAIGLETGSIDFVFTKKGEFVFLEVNPIGQFGMTSKPCNYYLEKIIAQELNKTNL
ncbi:MAG: grasp-with-spasm system ATP-grasp peptide maturase [Chitinophagales bacterium]|nr:grasp-with-spasm system ATP-grasp peptide maturase [Chitinophagales bacterium]